MQGCGEDSAIETGPTVFSSSSSGERPSRLDFEELVMCVRGGGGRGGIVLWGSLCFFLGKFWVQVCCRIGSLFLLTPCLLVSARDSGYVVWAMCVRCE